MNFSKFLISFVISLGFILISSALAQDPEEPLISITTEDLDTGGAISAFISSPEALGLPQRGQDDQIIITVGANQIVNDPQSLFPAGLIGRSETAIMVDEDDGPVGENIVVGWNDADGFIAPFLLGGVSGWGFSSNSGTSFTDGGGMPSGTIPTSPPTTIVVAGDPWLELLRDDLGDGTFLYANLAVRLTGPGTGHSVEGITVHPGKVQSGVLTWGTPSLIPSPSPVVGPPFGVNFGLDKEAITVDRRSGSRAVYVSATNFAPPVNAFGQTSNIVLFRSFDGGGTFSGPTQVQGPGVDGVQGSMPAVGINGDVYVVWERGRFNHPLVTPANPFARIQFARSTDGGATFGSAIDVDTILAAARKPPAGYNRSRHNDFPRIAVAYNGFHQGRIYVVYHDAGTNPDLPGTVTLTGAGNPALPGVADSDVLLKFSDDGGQTWSAPTVVNGTKGDGKAQFWPCVSFGVSGLVDVVYYQDVETNVTPSLVDIETNRGLDGVGGRTRRSTRSSLVDVFIATSTNGGVSFGTPVKISDVTSNWSRTVSNIIPNMGDYITSVGREINVNTTRVYATWADSRVSIDINPGPGVDLRPIPSVAYASVDVTKVSSYHDYSPVAGVPKSSILSQNYPNPYNASTVIEYTLPQDGLTTLTVYNVLGQKVAKLVDEFQTAGKHQVRFEATDLSSGIYFYTLESGKLREASRMTLLK